MTTALSNSAAHILVILVTAAGCSTAPAPVTPSAAAVPAPSPQRRPPPPCASTPEEASRSAVGAVVEAQRAYLEGGNTKPFSSLLLSEAEIQAGRSRSPGSFDFAFSKRQLDDIYRWAALNDGQSKAKLTTVDARALADTFLLELRLDTIKTAGEWSFSQQFELVCRAGAWRIARFRYWPLNPDTGEEFTQFFIDTDAQIERDLADGDLRDAAYRMMLAYRFNECAALSRRLTTDTPEDVWAWELRAKASALVGDRNDADQAVRIARALAQREP